MGIFGGYDRNAAMQGQSGFAPMNKGFTPPAEQKKPGFFGKGGGFVDLLGAIGDTFSPDGPMYYPQKQRQNELMQRERMAEQQRMQGREDFIFEREYDRANPKPVNNDTVADFEYIKNILGEDAAKKMLQNKVNPPQYRQGADGRFYRIDTVESAPPTFTDDDWNKGQPVGGSVGNGTGSFRY